MSQREISDCGATERPRIRENAPGIGSIGQKREIPALFPGVNHRDKRREA
jgi:hypothetical protein